MQSDSLIARKYGGGRERGEREIRSLSEKAAPKNDPEKHQGGNLRKK